jgi:hypothetical protein
VLEEFGNVIAQGGSCVVIASQSGHRLPALTPEEDKALATTPADKLLDLPMLQAGQTSARMSDPLHAYRVSKRGNSLRVMAEAVRRGPPPLRQAQAPRTAPGNICARRNQDGPSLLL